MRDDSGRVNSPQPKRVSGDYRDVGEKAGALTKGRRTPPILCVGDRLQAEPHKVRQRVLEILDEMSAPMTARQLEDALLTAGGFTRSERRKIVNALKVLPVIAIGAGQPRTLSDCARRRYLP